MKWTYKTLTKPVGRRRLQRNPKGYIKHPYARPNNIKHNLVCSQTGDGLQIREAKLLKHAGGNNVEKNMPFNNTKLVQSSPIVSHPDFWFEAEEATRSEDPNYT